MGPMGRWVWCSSKTLIFDGEHIGEIPLYFRRFSTPMNFVLGSWFLVLRLKGGLKLDEGAQRRRTNKTQAFAEFCIAT